MKVGTEEQLVEPGDLVSLDEPLKQMPFTLPCRGFVGVRYTSQNLHKLDLTSAVAEIRALKLTPR